MFGCSNIQIDLSWCLGQKQNMELFLKNPYFPHVAEGTMYQNQLLHPDMNTILLDVVNT